MKSIVFLGDGMADEPFAPLDGHTPLELAKHPNIDVRDYIYDMPAVMAAARNAPPAAAQESVVIKQSSMEIPRRKRRFIRRPSREVVLLIIA